MVRLTSVDYNIPHVRNKVNFFLNYLKHYASEIGKSPFYPYDNILSIVNRIEFQITKNSKNAHRYLPGLIRDFDKFNYDIFKEMASVENVSTQLSSYTTVKKNKTLWIKSNKLLLSSLTILKEELEEKMFSKCLEELIVALSCKHSLRFHYVLIKELTQVIVSEMLFANRSGKDVGDIVRKILSNDKNLFPLRSDIENLRGTPEFEKVVEEYFNLRTLKQQFLGIEHFYKKEPFERYFILRVDNIDFYKGQGIELEGVKFISKSESILKPLKVNKDKSTYVKRFWGKRKSSVAYVKVKYYELDIGRGIAIQRIQDAVRNLNSRLDVNANVYKNGFYYTDDFKKPMFCLGGGDGFVKLKKNRLEKLKDDNMAITLNKNDSKAKEQVLSVENLYNNALCSGKLTDYWQYLECLLHMDRQNLKGSADAVIIASRILAQFYRRDHRYDISVSIFNTYHTNSFKGGEYEFTYEEARKFTSDIPNCDIFKLTERFNDPILNELKKMYRASRTKKFRSSSFDYFKSLFWELYESRNSSIHMAYSIERNSIKLKRLIPYFCRKLRYVISNEILKFDRIVLPDIIKRLEGTGLDENAES